LLSLLTKAWLQNLIQSLQRGRISLLVGLEVGVVLGVRRGQRCPLHVGGSLVSDVDRREGILVLHRDVASLSDGLEHVLVHQNVEVDVEIGESILRRVHCEIEIAMGAKTLVSGSSSGIVVHFDRLHSPIGVDSLVVLEAAHGLLDEGRVESIGDAGDERHSFVHLVDVAVGRSD
jgi:hypothetical protein